MSDQKLALQNFTIIEARWETYKSVLSSLRREVFIVEQRVPQEEEWDGRDLESLHWLATEIDGKAIGTTRLLPEGQIGRMAVLEEYRGKGVGKALLEQAIDKACKLEFSSVYLHAQSHALAFYQKAGFVSEGGEFLEADIPHRRMVLHLSSAAETPSTETPSAKNVSGSKNNQNNLSIRTFDIAETSWRQDKKAIYQVREDTFVKELGLPSAVIQDSTDELDSEVTHWVARISSGQIVGVVRMSHEGVITGLAVLPEHRHQGIAYSLLDSAITKGYRLGLAQIMLTAVDSLSNFYLNAGFRQNSDAYLDDGRTYQDFIRSLPMQQTHRLDDQSLQNVSRSLVEGNPHRSECKIGESNQIILLKKEEEFLSMILKMSSQASVSIRLHSPLLDHKLFDNKEVRDFFSALARKNRYTSIEILTYDSHRIIKNGHLLLELSRRLSSSMTIRLVHPDYQQSNQEYLLVDGIGFIFRQDYEKYEGVANFKDVSEVDRLTRQFLRAWETSVIDPNFRQLNI